MAELTPMMQQYRTVKERNPDCILFFRLGDFYEMFDEDARIASRELDLTLTSRDHAKDKAPEDKVPMCGVPFHSSESYIARLVQKGYKVAICEQMEDPALAKGLVKRDIIRIVTPGTVTESSMLDESKTTTTPASTQAKTATARRSAIFPQARSTPRILKVVTRRKPSATSWEASAPRSCCSAGTRKIFGKSAALQPTGSAAAWEEAGSTSSI